MKHNPLAASIAEASDNRERLLQAALLLFRGHGYHGVGVSDILKGASLPKGSLYHHFPGGKDQIAVEVIARVADSAIALIEHAQAPTTAARVRKVGAQIQTWMVRTGDGTLALLASFAAGGDTRPVVRAAVADAYERIAAFIARYLRADGLTEAAARDRAFLVLALLEGGGLTSLACQQTRLFTKAVACAASVCELPASAKTTSPAKPAQAAKPAMAKPMARTSKS